VKRNSRSRIQRDLRNHNFQPDTNRIPLKSEVHLNSAQRMAREKLGSVEGQWLQVHCDRNGRHLQRTFLILKKKIKETYEITLPSVSPLTSRNGGARRGNCSINTCPRQRIHTKHQKNTSIRCFLCGPCRIQYSLCSERKVVLPRICFFVFKFVAWNEAESTWFSAHYWDYCTKPGWFVRTFQLHPVQSRC
jgi:hypothetical protein